MVKVTVKTNESGDALKAKAEKIVGGAVEVKEGEGDAKTLQLTQSQADKLNRLSLEERRRQLGGPTSQGLND